MDVLNVHLRCYRIYTPEELKKKKEDFRLGLKENKLELK
jgi:hypothetical protein